MRGLRASVLALWCAGAAAVSKAANGTLCRQCSRSSRLHASRALDEFAMGALASLVYNDEWVNVSRSVTVGSAPVGGERHHPWLMRLRERARWARCVLRRGALAPRPPGGHPSARVLRVPDETTRTRVPEACPGVFERRWTVEYLFRDWYEPGPAKTRWHATTALVAKSPSGAVAVAFMGSSDARHAVTNLQLLANHGDDEGRTLRGMRNAFERVSEGVVLRLGAGPAGDDAEFERDGVFGAVEDACAGRWETGSDPPSCAPERGLASLLTEIAARALEDRDARVYATGHSLGGALALQLALAALDAAPRRARAVDVFTFGEPPYGDRTFFARKLAKHPRLPGIYDRTVAVTAPPRCKTDIVPDTTRIAGGGGHFARPRFLCADDPPKNVLKAHSMVGYYRALRDHAKRDFGLNFTYDGPGFWGSDPPDDPLLVAALDKAAKDKRKREDDARRKLDRERRRERSSAKPLFPGGLNTPWTTANVDVADACPRRDS